MRRSIPSFWQTFALTAATLCAFAAVTVAAPEQSREAAFVEENNAAMEKMMAAMQVRPSGNIDRDFVVSMIPHHQGAIDMALAELHYGSNERLRRIAQGIIVEQQQEIAAMHLVLDQELPPSVASPAQTSVPPAPAPAMHHSAPAPSL